MEIKKNENGTFDGRMKVNNCLIVTVEGAPSMKAAIDSLFNNFI